MEMVKEVARDRPPDQPLFLGCNVNTAFGRSVVPFADLETNLTQVLHGYRVEFDEMNINGRQ
jgi:hypothetical protein